MEAPNGIILINTLIEYVKFYKNIVSTFKSTHSIGMN